MAWILSHACKALSDLKKSRLRALSIGIGILGFGAVMACDDPVGDRYFLHNDTAETVCFWTDVIPRSPSESYDAVPMTSKRSDACVSPDETVGSKEFWIEDVDTQRVRITTMTETGDHVVITVFSRRQMYDSNFWFAITPDNIVPYLPERQIGSE